MSKKIIVVGGVAGGASAATRARRLDRNAEITIYDRNDYVSFSNCCLPYYLGDEISSSDKLILMTKEKFKNQHNIDVHTGYEVIEIKKDTKKIVIKNLKNNEVEEKEYDKLILSPGAKPIKPKNIEEIDSENVFTVRNVDDVVAIKDYIEGKNKIAVIGGGFIGVEVAENLRNIGKDITLIEGTNQIMAPYDYDMVQTLHKELMDNGINLKVSSTVKSIKNNKVIYVKNNKENAVEAEAVIMAIGVYPENELAKSAGLDIGESGGIAVNEFYQTSDKDIYAVGDAIEVQNKFTGKGRLSLAGPAQKEARVAINHIYNKPTRALSFIGSSCIKVFGLNAASTGLNEKMANNENIDYEFAYILPSDKVGIMPESHYMQFKLLFEKPTGRILGAQAIGKGNVDKRIDVIATMISMNGTLEDLSDLELCYAPPFSTAKDVTNLAALVGLNLLDEEFKQVHVDKVRSLVENGEYIVDVREMHEYERSHIKGSYNVPLSQIHQRYNEIPKDRKVYLHCRSSQRSYFAIRYLQNMGYTNLYNISGSYLGISLYEYFDDIDKKRESILTDYNFR